ncbi:hypothetical protein NBRC116597_13610 [Phaeobacter sp. NW0010-22]
MDADDTVNPFAQDIPVLVPIDGRDDDFTFASHLVWRGRKSRKFNGQLSSQSNPIQNMGLIGTVPVIRAIE